MSDVSKTNEALIAELRKVSSRYFEVGWDTNATLFAQAADALEAATRVLVQGEPNDGREVLAKVMDTLAYYHCRSVNPKADHPRMGYHAMSEDQREFLQERQREAAEEILRMLPALSRATVPDAATGRFECDRECIGEGEPVEDCSAHGRTPRDLWEQIDKVAAERDAALAAVERMRAIHFRRESQYRRFTDQSVIHCGTCTYAEWPCPTIAALDGAPEPEWEYGYAEKLGDTEYVYGDERDVPGWFTTAEEASAARIEDTDYVVGRRKAGPWVPVESEEK